MNKLPKEKQLQLLAIAGAALVICGLLWFFVIGTQLESRQRCEESIRDLQDKIHKASTRIKRRATIASELADLEEQLARLEAQMIPAEQLSGNKWLLDLLTGFIKDRHAVEPTFLSNDALIGKQFLALPKLAYSAAAYNVEFRGHFHDFGKFLAELENAFPFMSVHSLELWPLATPRAATGPVPDLPEEFQGGAAREELKITMKLVLLFKPAGSI